MGNLNFFIVFVEGVLSIFSPCILPILPIYLSILSNSSVEDIQDPNFKSGRLIKNTIFFTIGISTTFFILGSSINVLSSFFNTNRNLIMLIGGIVIIFMGLFYLDIIKSDVLNREKRLNIRVKTMSPLSAFLLGFTFSLGWTPCIGPILASVLIMASSSDSILASNLLILVYTIGFILPFIIAALFYNRLFKKFDKVKTHMQTIKKISGVFILIAGGIMLFNGVTNIGKQLNAKHESSVNTGQVKQEKEQEQKVGGTQEAADDRISPIDFTLYDQYGNEHTLSDYKGKTIFLNFWATWCPPCRAEMPHMEELYKEYNENQDDVVILGVASPHLGSEGSEEHIKEFLNQEGHTFPVVLDKEGSMVYLYGINAFPTTFMIDKEGYISRYIPGAMSKSTMKELIEAER